MTTLMPEESSVQASHIATHPRRPVEAVFEAARRQRGNQTEEDAANGRRIAMLDGSILPTLLKLAPPSHLSIARGAGRG
jgi:hypothetical protein